MKHTIQSQPPAHGRPASPPGRERPRRNWAALLTLLALGAMVGAARAQLPIPPSSQFSIVGFLDNATLDNPVDVLSGGTVTVNGQLIIVPRNTIVEMPAAALTWQEIFALAPPPYGIPGSSLAVTAIVPETGLSLSDTVGTPQPLSTYEFTVVGNRVISAAGDQFIAALIYISQASLNSGQGYINFIDYVNGEIRVGGTIGSSTNGVRVRINDPVITDPADPAVGAGRYSKGQSPDVRFTCDQQNPTITSQTGFPMGLPATDPAIADDPMRPDRNRPLNGNPAFPQDGLIPVGAPLANFTMPAPALVTATSPTPWIEAPFKVGDFITYSGTLVQDGDPTRGPTTGPLPTNGVAGTYISAHTINNNVAIYTAPGTTPAYVIINVMLVGTGGANVAGVAEATARTRFEGFTSDATPISATTGLSTNNIHLFAMDVNPITGAVTDRDWGSQDVDPGPPTGAAKGRWRHRPPNKVLTHPASGAYAPPTREVRAALSFGEVQEGATPQPQNYTLLPQLVTTNGILSGQYHAPIFEYLFPEQILGNPIPPINDETLAFLAHGIGPLAGAGTIVSASNPIVGQLAPWPGAVAPAPVTAPTAAVAISTATVSSGTTVSILDGTPSTDPNGLPLTYAWTQPAGQTIVLSSTSAVKPTFTAPTIAVGGANIVLTFTLTVSDSFLSSAPQVATVTITVTAPAAQLPIAVVGPNQTVSAGTIVTLDGSGSLDLNGLPLNYVWTQTAGPLVALSPNNTVAKPTFSTAGLVAPTSLTFSLHVSDALAQSALPDPTVTITVNAVADAITIAGVVYRSGQQRLTVTATSSAGAAATLTLQAVPSLNVPTTVMTLVLGIPTADLRGVSLPSPTQLFTVTSSLGGAASSVVTLFR